jgi:hypothetical protein
VRCDQTGAGARQTTLALSKAIAYEPRKYGLFTGVRGRGFSEVRCL